MELGYFIALTYGQQRWIKTLGIGHGEVLDLTKAGLAQGRSMSSRIEPVGPGNAVARQGAGRPPACTRRHARRCSTAGSWTVR